MAATAIGTSRCKAVAASVLQTVGRSTRQVPKSRCRSAWCFYKHCDRWLQVHANANTTAAKFELSRGLFSCAGCSNVHTCLTVDILHVSYDALCQIYTHTVVVQSLLLGCGD